MKVYGWDLETNQLSPFIGEPKILTVSVCSGKKPRGAVMDHPLQPPWEQDEKTLAFVRGVLADPNNVIVGHNLVGFDVPMWETVTGQRIEAKLFDTQVAYALVDENVEVNTLDYLARKYTSRVKNEGGLDRRRLAETDPKLVLKYNLQDTLISYELYAPLLAELQERGLEELMRFRMEVGRVLIDMTERGVWVDKVWAKARSEEIYGELEGVEKSLHESIGDREVVKRKYDRKTKTHTESLVYEPYNLRSSTQLRELLYGVFRLPVLERTSKREPSTKASAVREIRAVTKSPVLQDFLDRLLLFRKNAKLGGTYLAPLTTKHYGNDGRVHTTFNLAGTVTGRLSSSGPNLQNIPRDKRVKGVLAATPDLRMFHADYSQLELRVAAWYSGEPSMLRAFAENLDVHTLTLAEVEGKPYEWVKQQVEINKEWEERRALFKRINFGTLYGAGPFRIVKLLRDMDIFIDVDVAAEYSRKWFAKYTRLAEWIEETRREIVQRGFVTTPTGHVRRLPDADPTTSYGQALLRQGVNFMIQSLAGELALAALLEVDRFLTQEGGAHLLLTVHDSLEGEYHPDDYSAEEMTASLTHLMTTQTLGAMERRFNHEFASIPLAVDVKAGLERWA